jgi:putative redox protein
MNGSDKPMKINLDWRGDLHFESTNDSGVRLHLDGDSEAGFSPMQGLLASLCGCMGIDVVVILRKMRADLKGMKVIVTGVRNSNPPKYFRKIGLEFEVEGSIPDKQINRAIKLSLDKYCSVLHTLRKEIEVDYHVTIKS